MNDDAPMACVCPDCDGRKRVVCDCVPRPEQMSNVDEMVGQHGCKVCNGDGDHICPRCIGTGCILEGCQ